jgi:hypothetical protein
MIFFNLEHTIYLCLIGFRLGCSPNFHFWSRVPSKLQQAVEKSMKLTLPTWNESLQMYSASLSLLMNIYVAWNCANLLGIQIKYVRICLLIINETAYSPGIQNQTCVRSFIRRVCKFELCLFAEYAKPNCTYWRQHKMKFELNISANPKFL